MILITMAGLSSRFFDVGYTVPKYQLLIDGKSVFYHSVMSFKQYFADEKFVFVIRDIFNTKHFIKSEIQKLGIIDNHIIVLDRETEGQAETAYLALQHFSGDFPVYIFNIDTFRHNYLKPTFVDVCDGYLEVFEGDGDNWSFVLPDINNQVIKTTEKERISNLCSDGLYYFKSKNVFESLFLKAQKDGETTKGEFYIAPLYNELIHQNGIVLYQTVLKEDIDFCGTPNEYQLLLNRIDK